jgi:tRNA threonylcarbamoyl adenosine modification protein YeaZ
MILAFDISSAACTVALFDAHGDCIAHADEQIGRGHSERLVPMISEMLGGRTADKIIAGVGPGSFTGIRVAIAAAHGLAIGWDAEIAGMSSLALIAAGAGRQVAVAVLGGHGELFVQQFDAEIRPETEILNLTPERAANVVDAPLVIGSGAQRLVDARGWGEASEAWPRAAEALRLPEGLRSLPAKPLYVRAPDARVMEPA